MIVNRSRRVHRRTTLTLACATAALTASLAAPVAASTAATSPAGACTPRLTSTSAAVATRSDLLVLTGSCFGGPTGRASVTVNGIAAPVARWTDTEIAAYVPESAPLGAATVQIDSAGGTQQAAVSVVDRAAKGRLQWRFRAAGMYMLSHPVIAPDGTVYVNDVDSHLYALTRDGALKWLLNGAGDEGVALGPDGTVYVGSTGFITAVNPDGTIKWRYTQSPQALTLLGPSVGPDGNIYAVASNGLGVFSLTPAGSLRWSVHEAYDRLIVENQDLVFGPAPGGGQQLYFHANKHFEAVRLDDGDVTFSIYGDGHAGCGAGDQPVVGPNGRAYTTNWTIGEGEKLGSYKPNGSLDWTFVYQPNNCSSAPAIGPDGKIYIVWNISRLFAVTPSGSATELAVDTDDVLQHPSVSPQGNQVVVPGSGIEDHRGVVNSWSTRDGSLLWSVDLPDVKGATQVPMSAFGVPFAPDGKTAYVTTIVSGVYDRSFLYAVDTRR